MLVLTASGGYIDEASNALSSTNVFVSPEVAGATGLREQLSQQVSGDGIAVAVFSTNANLEASTVDIVAALREAHPEYGTIIVAVGNDVAAGSSAIPNDQALRIANESEALGGPSASIPQTITGVMVASDRNLAQPGDAAAGDPVLGIVLAVSAVVVGVGVTIGLIAGTRRRRRAGGARGEQGPPDSIRAHLAALTADRGAYAAAGAAGNTAAARTAEAIGALVANVPELFRRLQSRADDGQRGIAAVEYDDKLRRLSGALQRDYLLDIQTRPDLWDDPEERAREVEAALGAVSEEVVANIKQVNARRALHFQVSLDGLMGKRRELQEWDRAFDSAEGSEGSGPGGTAQ
ncbi:hypothetical protein [Microbacterium sp. CJ88]|uniref:hypothetical protein n=1 Tax=Microbacterium sp. CJ88 TaxID=3445672 RepID=UPI003F65E910